MCGLWGGGGGAKETKYAYSLQLCLLLIFSNLWGNHLTWTRWTLGGTQRSGLYYRFIFAYVLFNFAFPNKVISFFLSGLKFKCLLVTDEWRRWVETEWIGGLSPTWEQQLRFSSRWLSPWGVWAQCCPIFQFFKLLKIWFFNASFLNF